MDRIDVTVTGGCQCGAVRYRATAMLDNSHLCHCRMCQKASGNLFAALVAAPNDALEWTRGVPATFRSSEHVDRGFCAACGTPVFYRGSSGRTNLMIGTLDDPAAFEPRVQMGSEARMPWFERLCGLPDEGETGADAPEWAEAIRLSNRQHPDHD
ncbi:GFA family protein [Sphingomonas sp. AOB5]|uniref:GFA family protein n=1 Tax=Sphingomonas sp. AOB5 TaxID=3034017 RepID=UPI0023F61ACF|nr:GFA family protein [Sphingomonas sp. AOB5]MDF7776225.1 GFA family protein [Sphingomonas sp. AOB5]